MTLFWFEIEVIFGQDIENFMDVFSVPLQMLFFCFMYKVFGVDYSIVHVDREVFGLHLKSEDCIYHGLKGCQGVCHTEEHYKWFKESFYSEKCSFPFVPLVYPDVVVSPSNIKLGEESTSCQSIYNLGNQQGNVLVMFCVFVKGSIILYGL